MPLPTTESGDPNKGMTERTSAPSDLRAYFHECFDYRDGRLIWKERPAHHSVPKHWNGRYPRTEAGTINHKGYRMVNLRECRWGIHRIIFVMHHGYLPETVDHINGDQSDNRIENLRAATRSENSRNVRTHATNTSGVKGVYAANGKWKAWICINGRDKSLGAFNTLEHAAAVRREAERIHYGEFANDR